ncbi:MAG: hypothetical protein OQK56_00675 [Ignavibacteriaceae bacterium]|jgi:hypothetical protein|nr:hypothetical protein [Ignavibacteriaceae bacterium]
MTGKAILLVVIGFSLTLLAVGQRFGSVSNRAVDNYIKYQNETVAHNIAISGANIAANAIYMNPVWDEGYSVPFQNGHLDITVDVVNASLGFREITSRGIFFRDTSEIVLRIAPSNFSEYAYYSTYERSSPSSSGKIWWTGKDTVWGPFHTQDNLNVYQHPSFLGKHTSHKKSINYYTNKSTDAPVITGIYEPGKNLEIPTQAVENLEAAADDNGLKFKDKDSLYLIFDKDTLRYKYNYSEKYTALYLPSAAPNGLIYAKDMVVHLQGIVKGKYTLGCSSSTSSTDKGSIWLDDNIVYNTDPQVDPNSSDLFGIVAENYVWITENAANHHDINIHASVFSEKWGFGAYNYKNRSVDGDINLLGGIQQNYRQPVGTFGSKGIQSGFTKQYRYDWRLQFMSPPFYPGTGGFKIVSWFE